MNDDKDYTYRLTLKYDVKRIDLLILGMPMLVCRASMYDKNCTEPLHH